NYVDIFDGGPTMTCPTDAVRTVAASRVAPVAELADGAGGLPGALLAVGRLGDFRSWIGHADWCADGLVLPAGEAELMRLGQGDEVRHVGI
ncbi:MAG: arginine N-succinyltransferase, partial [Sphingomonadaceae bacterium]|nr:arginine N-succinyltransferase [Sphingomonadaceae bacterium]